jgi:type IV secretory pathway component VirB8
MIELYDFLSGATALACFAVATFFFRFWRETRDRLFLLFALSFVFMTINRTVLVLFTPSKENEPFVYLLRLAAFVVIAFAVIDKNRKR